MRLHNRQIKANFWNDPDIVQWPRDKRWFYEGLIQLADDSGCLEDAPFSFKLQLFPSPVDSDITVELLSKWKDELVSEGKLVQYEASNKRCLYLTKFHKHQSLKNPDRPEVPLPQWITWTPYPSNDRQGKFTVSDDVLNQFLQGSYACLTSVFQPEPEVEPEKEPEQRQGAISIQSAVKEVAATSDSFANDSSSSLGIGDVAKTFESEGFGQITATVRDYLIELSDDFSPVWVIEAMKEAVFRGKRRLNYVHSILTNWRSDGGVRRSNGEVVQLPQKNRAGPGEQTPVRDERYAAFYQLYPDG